MGNCWSEFCLFTGFRIWETLVLQKSDVKVNPITSRKSTIKGKLKTSAIYISQALQRYMSDYDFPVNPDYPYLFLSSVGKTLSRFMADEILRAVCQRIFLENVSIYGFSSTA